MFDIGIGELVVLGALGLLIFGPERLPKAAADAGRWARQLREMASGARRDLVDSAGLDMSETTEAFRGLAELHPRRLATSIMADEPVRPAANGTAAANGGAAHGAPPKPGPQPPAAAQGFDPDTT